MLAVSFVSLGLRAGAVVALAIPLVLAITFIVMRIFGISLQRVSLGALIIALGLLVDDAMITVEMMVAGSKEGDDRKRPRPSPTGRRPSDADGHAGHDRGLHADRPERHRRPANIPSRCSS